MQKPVFLSWSSGKDAAMALYILQQSTEYRVGHLLTTVDAGSGRVGMHRLHPELLEAQAESLGIPKTSVFVEEGSQMIDYNETLLDAFAKMKADGYNHGAYGDIFLEDLKSYREHQLNKAGINPIFPLWKMDTRSLMQRFLKAGFKAVVICTSDNALETSFCGRKLDQGFLEDLPEEVDACGENGEYHTFVYDGPIFSRPVAFKKGKVYAKQFTGDGDWDQKFHYCDLLPA